jgi:hypothetical protein
VQAFPLMPEKVARQINLASSGARFRQLALNWRNHSETQGRPFGLLSEIGDVVRVRKLPDEKLIIIDGHLRAQPASTSTGDREY